MQSFCAWGCSSRLRTWRPSSSICGCGAGGSSNTGFTKSGADTSRDGDRIGWDGVAAVEDGERWARQRGKASIGKEMTWSGRLDSNQRPLRPERSALPSCATPRHVCNPRGLHGRLCRLPNRSSTRRQRYVGPKLGAPPRGQRKTGRGLCAIPIATASAFEAPPRQRPEAPPRQCPEAPPRQRPEAWAFSARTRSSRMASP